jgi:hypothetical protein
MSATKPSSGFTALPLWQVLTTPGRSRLESGRARRPQISLNQCYMAEMSACFAGMIDGLTCPYEGWSAAIYPFDQSRLSATQQQGSSETPRSIAPREGASLTEPDTAHEEGAQVPLKTSF